MESEKQNGQQKVPPVYLSFKTFQSAIQSLRTHGLPDSLDRTAFGSRSGAEQTQILSAFKFLGFIDEKHRTQPVLRALVKAQENSNDEKTLLAATLRERYANAFALNLEAATPAQLDKAIAEYGAGGTTKERSIRFFIKASEHAGIRLSARLTARKARSTSGDSESANGQNSHKSPRKRKADIPPPPPVTGSAVKTVTLRNTGGTLTLSGTFSAFDLDGDERKLVYDIVDLMKAYERTGEQ